MDQPTKYTFSDEEKKEFRLLEQAVLQGKLQLADLELHKHALLAREAELVAAIQAGGKQLTDRIQLAMKVRGLDPNDMTQRYNMDMRELVLEQAPAAPAVQ